MGWLKELETKFKITIDREQYQAIVDHHQCLQIIAGAGSGKTFTICCKVYYLVYVKHVPSEKILMLSYTNYACSEIKKYFKQMNLTIQVITFHKFALNVLKHNRQSFVIETDIEQVNKRFLEHLRTDDRNYYEALLLSYMTTSNIKKRLLKYWYRLLWKLKPDLVPSWLEEEIIKELQEQNNTLLQQKFESYKERNHIIFLSDMVKRALDLLKEKNCIYLDYEYIMIDEFQDISKERFDFIFQYYQLTKCHVVAVGDDYQSIYRFADSDVDYFIHFLDYFSPGIQIFLNHTYRNSQELLVYAEKVISRNNNQIRKKLYSEKHLKFPIKQYYYTDEKIYVKQIKHILEQLFQTTKPKKILILSRYQFDLEIMKEKTIYHMLKKCPPWIQVDMLTIHKAKGLGYDEVLLLNLRTGKYGFPSTEMDIDLEEERRLFYVALTRTKNYVYLLIPQKNPSIFVEELLSE